MRAKINGFEVEGTPEELRTLLGIQKDTTTKREEPEKKPEVVFRTIEVRGKRRRKYIDWQKNKGKLARLYSEGKSVKGLAREFGCSIRAIRGAIEAYCATITPSKVVSHHEPLMLRRKPVLPSRPPQVYVKEKPYPELESVKIEFQPLAKDILRGLFQNEERLTWKKDGYVIGFDKLSEWGNFMAEVMLKQEALKNYYGVVGHLRSYYHELTFRKV